MKHGAGFTLIELSIVLVIIGLIVGGILTGEDLIRLASTRAQISQMEKYNTSVRTFQNKYGYLPGDIPEPYATNFGFIARGTGQGEGDGNGILEGMCDVTAYGLSNGSGELAVFWRDLSTANLIDTAIATGGGTGSPHPTGSAWPDVTAATTPAVKDWLPTAKLGNGIYIYVFSLNGMNYYGVSTVDTIGCSVQSLSSPGLTVQQAYNIDQKIDDGLPQSGSVMACYVNFDVANYSMVWAAGNNLSGTGNNNCMPKTTATAYLTTNCYDNNGSVGTQTYSRRNANIPNCGLSFKFQ